MSIPPESIEAGKCYLMKTGQLRRVIHTLDGKIGYHARQQVALNKGWLRREVTNRKTFAVNAVKEVPCPPDLLVLTGEGL